jgi:hypothetical protein
MLQVADTCSIETSVHIGLHGPESLKDWKSINWEIMRCKKSVFAYWNHFNMHSAEDYAKNHETTLMMANNEAGTRQVFLPNKTRSGIWILISVYLYEIGYYNISIWCSLR